MKRIFYAGTTSALMIWNERWFEEAGSALPTPSSGWWRTRNSLSTVYLKWNSSTKPLWPVPICCSTRQLKLPRPLAPPALLSQWVLRLNKLVHASVVSLCFHSSQLNRNATAKSRSGFEFKRGSAYIFFQAPKGLAQIFPFGGLPLYDQLSLDVTLKLHFFFSSLY